ncbi:MAG: excinuclease ABC subunit A [Gammaproteobacteria bacterium]|nr:excinuclease ABC subunit A [Gammaproteobacteria bacterium]
MNLISIRGAKTHNLKDFDLDIPRNKLVVITGLSGSGKSSLAFDTLYAEGQRRYVESLSAYARQFLSLMEKPDVEHIDGLSPAISIEQKSTSHNPRSTVGTITEIYDYLRLLFARVGEPHCPEHGIKLEAQSVSQMVDQVLALPAATRVMILAPIIKNRKGEHLHVFKELRSHGFVRAKIDGIVAELDEAPTLDKNKKHSIAVVVDRFRIREDIKTRLADSFETAISVSDGLATIAFMDDTEREDLVFSAKFACPECGHSISDLEPRFFSFNNPAGTCPSCDGLGVNQIFDAANIISDPDLSLAEGAIHGWDRRSIYYYQMLNSIAEHYGFELTTAFRELDEQVQDIILQGSGSEKIRFKYVNDRGDGYTKAHTFEGVIPNMERRYKDTDSQVVRDNLTKFLSTQSCKACNGARLNADSRAVTINGVSLPEFTTRSIFDAIEHLANLTLTGQRAEVAEKILKEIGARLGFLMDVGLNYLTLSRSANTLSGGEAQRIRLASQIGAGLVGVMYILDEPSIGLHQRDNKRLLNTLTRLRDLGNTVIVVEHDSEAIYAADHIIDMGPGAGVYGGEVVAHGNLEKILESDRSVTGQFLSGKRRIEIPLQRTPYDQGKVLQLIGASGNNLKMIDLTIPLGLLTCVTGVSGSGKSTLINHTIYPIAARQLNGAVNPQAANHLDIKGLDQLDKVVDIDQSPIGRTPRSNPATYTNIFTPLRELFSGTQEARSRGYKPGRFSFNVKGGRCEACQGDGLIKVEMHFLPDVYVTCDECKGKRYNRETLEIKYKGKSIHQVLEMTVEESYEFLEAVPMIERRLKTLLDVGLGYIKLGQSATTLSGGEAQRVKLARELSKRDTGKTLYILDEPTTGLHFHDIEQLLEVIHRLRDHGNTIIVIEHNLDVIKTADWVVDLGPEGGDGGGEIIACGTPEQVAESTHSFTGQFLKPVLMTENAFRKQGT